MSNQTNPIDRIYEEPLTRRELMRAGGTTLAATSLLGVLASCGGGGGGDSLTLSTSSNLKPTVSKLIDKFNQEHPDLPSVQIRTESDDTDQYFDQIKTQFQAGSEDISVIAGDVIWPSQLAEPGWISDLSNRFTRQQQEAFLPGTVAAMEYKNKIWGVPWFTDAGLLYYRADLLEKSGFSKPPTTWDELKDMAAKVTRDSGVQNGFVFTGAIYEGGTVLGTEFIRNAGGDILDGNKVVIGSPQAIEGLGVEQSLVADGIAPEAVANYKEDEATAAFGRGDAVFMRMWPFYYTELGVGEQSKLKPEQVGLGQVPVVSTDVKPTNVGGGWNYYLNASAADPADAWTLIEFMTAPAQQKQMALGASVLPTRKSLYDDKEILQKMPAVRLGKEAILSTTTPPVSPYYADMSAKMAEQFNANILGKVAPDDAASTLQDDLEQIIEQGEAQS